MIGALFRRTALSRGAGSGSGNGPRCATFRGQFLFANLSWVSPLFPAPLPQGRLPKLSPMTWQERVAGRAGCVSAGPIR
eukprot:1825382-Pyramimonas_sp.AAC.2